MSASTPCGNCGCPLRNNEGAGEAGDWCAKCWAVMGEDCEEALEETSRHAGTGCHGCRHLQSSGYSYWCSKDGCKCTRGAVPEQADCFEPNRKEGE